MSFIKRKIRWNKKPSRSVKIGWGNPITKGLVLCVYPDLNSIEKIHGSRGINSGAENTASTEGKHLLLGTLNDYQRYDHHLSQHITDEITMVFDGAINSMGSFGSMFSIPYRDDASWDSPWFSLAFHRNNATDRGRFAYTVGGLFKNAVSDAGYLKIDGSKHQYSVHRLGNQVKFYRDGIKYGATITVTSGVGNIDFNNDAPIHLGTRNYLTPDESMTGIFKAVHIFNRGVTARELLSLHQEPYQLHQPLVRRIPLKLPIPSGVSQEIVVIDSGQSDAIISVTYHSIKVPEASHLIVFRYLSTGNCMALLIDPVNSQHVLLKVVAGVITIIATHAEPILDDEHTMRVEILGDNIKFYHDEILKIDATDATHITGTSHGLGVRFPLKNSSHFDSFKIQPLAS